MQTFAIDFEASCLPQHGRSYPIEVGVSEDGQTARSWLIRPHSAWDSWSWTEEAERLHGLTQCQLWRDGLPAELVAAELSDMIAGTRVIADSRIDAYWLDTLYAAVAKPRPVTITCVSEILGDLHLTSADIIAAEARVDARTFERHRAGEDARWLAALLIELGIAERSICRRLFNWQAPPTQAVPDAAWAA